MVDNIFAQQTQAQMRVGNQKVADALGEVCFLYKSDITREVEFGENRTVKIRKPRVGEVILFDRLGNGQNVRDVPIRSLTDEVVVYSNRSYDPWDNSAIENWKKMAIQSLERNREKTFNNFPKTTELKGFTLTSDTLAPVKAVITVFNIEGKVETVCASDENGKYSLRLPVGKYRFEVNSDNCLFYSDSVNVSEENLVIERYALLTRIRISSKIVLRNIFFEFSKATLLPESKPELDALCKFLKENKTIEIELSGHTDNKGSAPYNQKLSESRAKSVADYLIAHGIPKTRLKYIGRGFSQPVAPNNLSDGRDNPDGRKENRRTEFEVLKM